MGGCLFLFKAPDVCRPGNPFVWGWGNSEAPGIDPLAEESDDLIEASVGQYFLIDAGSGRLVGSKIPARGRKIRKTAMTTAWEARATILQLLFVSNMTYAPSSM